MRDAGALDDAVRVVQPDGCGGRAGEERDAVAEEDGDEVDADLGWRPSQPWVMS